MHSQQNVEVRAERAWKPDCLQPKAKGRWRQSSRKEERHICNDPLIKAI